MKRLNQIGTGLLILFLSGCQLVNPPTPTVEIQPSLEATIETTPTTPGAVSVDSFKNALFTAPQLQQTVQLTDGKYESGSGASYESLQLLDQAGFGDINGDGNADAALLLAENNGGSGVFVYLVAMINQGDAYAQLPPALIDDRPQINSVAIENGKVIVQAVIHSAGDPMATPSMNVVEEYQLTQAKMSLTKLNSTIAGAERFITINTPSDGAEVSSSMQVKGSVPISPFENTLAYRFYDQAGNLLIEGPFSVQSDGAGGAGTFDNSVAVPAATSGTSLLFVLTELSMADGSYLTLNAVNVVVK